MMVEDVYILIIEDDQVIAALMGETFKNEGYKVMVDMDGRALLNGNFSGINLLIIDNELPFYTGLEICKSLRTSATTMDLPIIMVSGSRNCRDKALKAGVNFFLEKPFNVKDLKKIVHDFCEQL